MSSDLDRNQIKSIGQDLYQKIERFQNPTLRESIWQIINTCLPYFLLWYVMIRFLNAGYPYWSVLLLAVPASLFMVRLFILFHDCTHGSFFSSKKANDIFGNIFGIITFTPYEKWKASHWRHHATVANLDRRGSGDYWTMTKDEYLSAPKWKRFVYRFARNPIVTFIFGPIFIFLIAQRLPIRYEKKRERNNIYITNIVILSVVLLFGFTIGFRTFFLIQLPITFFGGMLGLWLFYVQHNFEGVYWSRQEDWSRLEAAFEGSSFYKLPKVIQWFTGSIGFHNIHHVRPLIPNYRLEECYKSEAAFQEIKPLSVPKSLKSLRLHLWDETNKKLVGFNVLKNG
jgi:omega-6 fatty acid desaturase (delta-12 desaturase)